jgi:hypothetical protein
MKVHILIGYYWTSTNENPEVEIFGVFSTKEKAQKIINIWEKYQPDYMNEGFKIEEVELDEPLNLPMMYEIEMMRSK